ncbi:serine hydrolase, partial [Bacillus sp. SIMBA_069]
IELDPEYEINEQDKYSLAKIVPVDTYAEMFDYMAEQDFELLGTPGTEFSYSNESYAMLGVIIERLSGKTYEAYMKEHILVPAGMND